MSEHRSRRRGPRKDPRARKDRLIQTRVAGELEETLKREAERRRLSVSHLIRNVLEDSFHLVDAVVSEVDNIVQDSVDLAHQVRRDVRDLSRPPRRPETRTEAPAASGPAAEPQAEPAAEPGPTAASRPAVEAPATPAAEPAPTAADPLADIYAWNPVVLNRAARCVRCDAELARGQQAHLGLSSARGRPPTWLCDRCVSEL